MPKASYDLAFGLGLACSCTEALRSAKLQYLSFPFDWLTLMPDRPEAAAHDVRDRARILASGFADWFAESDFRYVQPIPATGKDLYVSDRLGLVFNHDFLTGVPFAQMFPKVRDKYRRRADRLLDLLRGARRVLVLRVERPDLPGQPNAPADCREALAELRKAFPNAAFDLALFTCEPGRPFGRRLVAEGPDGIVHYTFDYRSPVRGAPPFQIDLPRVTRLLKARAQVADYRTDDERRAFARTRRQKRYAKVGAANFAQYLWRRLFAR